MPLPFKRCPTSAKLEVRVEIESNKMIHLFAVPFQRVRIAMNTSSDSIKNNHEMVDGVHTRRIT